MRQGWDKPLTDWTQEVRTYANDEIRRLSKLAFNKIVARTPVRTGTLKAGWAMNELISEGVLSVVIYNNVEYVVFVEYGTDRIAGKYMVEQTLNELAEGIF